MAPITDPLFYAAAVPAGVLLTGLQLIYRGLV